MAVLTYLRHILEVVDHPDMINLILHYLLGLPDTVTSSPEAMSNALAKARKRKSMDLASMIAMKPDEAADPLLYTLVDLILACLRSPSHQTIHVTLQLVSAIIKRHHRYAVATLVRTENLYGDIPHRTIGAQQQEVEFLISLAGTIGGHDNFDEVYENILRDTTTRIESHPCSLRLTVPKISLNSHKSPYVPDSLPGAPRDVRPHTIRTDDPLLEVLLDHLELFFLNPVETNLGITETLFDLALCGFMNLEGWLLRHPEKYIYDADDAYQPPSPRGEDEDPLDMDLEELLSDDPKKIDEINRSRRRPTWSSSSLPRLLKTLQLLSDQVVAFRETIPRFNDLLQQRRESFQIADTAATPMPRVQQPSGTPVSGTPGRAPSSVADSRSGSPQRAGGLEGFAQRILKDLNELGTPRLSRSRTNSLAVPPPTGRPNRSNTLAVPGGPPLSTGFGLGSPSPLDRGPPVPPKEFPAAGYNTRARANSRPYTSAGPKWDPVKASQVAAFQAVDQQILARKVGLPVNGKVEPIPLTLGGRIEDDLKEGNEEEDNDGLDRDEGRPTSPAKEITLKLGEQDEETVDEDGKEDDKEDDQGDDQGDDKGDDKADDTQDPAPDTRPTTPPEEKKVSVSHVLTNIIVLQSFLFELAALVQVRAGLFDEVRFA